MIDVFTPAEPPRWDLESIFPGLDSSERTDSLRGISDAIAELDARLTLAESLDRENLAEVIPALEQALEYHDAVLGLSKPHRNYLICLADDDIRNTAAQQALSELDLILSRHVVLVSRLTAWIGSLDVAAIVEASEGARDHEFLLCNAHEQAVHLMHPLQEEIAAELNLAGGIAWEQMYVAIWNQMETTIEHDDGHQETIPVSELGKYYVDTDRDARRRAGEAETAAYRHWEAPLTAALNGVKGFQLALARRRGWGSVLDLTLSDNHIDRATLDAMHGAAVKIFPDFRRFMLAKAGLLGLDRMASWDFRAPVVEVPAGWPWERAFRFVVEQFATYSPELENLAKQAIEKRWIDVAPRAGKGDGGYSAAVGGGDSRILLNFVPGFDWTSVLAHELGHAYHNRVRGRRNPWSRYTTPLVLAETASTFCERIVCKGALQDAPEDERLEILSISLTDATIMIPGVYRSYLFEQQVFDRRSKGNLTAEEFEQISAKTRRSVFLDAIDYHPDDTHSWASTIHYYLEARPFYSYPYMFGLLFSLGLFARYEADPDSFRPAFDDFLTHTGDADAATLAARFDVDIRREQFWESSLDLIRRDIDTFVDLAERHGGQATPQAKRLEANRQEH